ncbi:MAG: hypothetical protein ACJ8FS_08875 [Sphingomicrobium sp.]
MTIRPLFAILVALSVLLAPAVTASASAAEPNHDMQMMQIGHCHGPMSGSAEHDRNTGKTCCISISLGLAVAFGTPLADEMVPTTKAVFAEPFFLLGEPSKLPTPPPRLS